MASKVQRERLTLNLEPHRGVVGGIGLTAAAVGLLLADLSALGIGVAAVVLLGGLVVPSTWAFTLGQLGAIMSLTLDTIPELAMVQLGLLLVLFEPAIGSRVHRLALTIGSIAIIVLGTLVTLLWILFDELIAAIVLCGTVLLVIYTLHRVETVAVKLDTE